jgi:hypothetical protein
MLMSALLIGFTTVVMSDQRYRFIDRDRGQAFYAASAGVEKLTADLGNLFFANVAPNAAQVTALTVPAKVPSMPGITFANAVAPQVLPTSSLTQCANPPAMTGAPGYSIMFCPGPTGNPAVTVATPVKTGPYEGLIAEQTPYQLDVSARTSTGGEVHLVRTMESVAIPVFQFGMFSDVDLAFFAGPDFNFGGRVHTNGNLFLSQGGGATLTLTDKVTAVKEIIRQRLQNTVSIDTAPTHSGTVNMARAANVFRPFLRAEGSLTDGLGSPQNEPTWHTTSLSTYNSWIRNGRTGAKALNLPLLTVGGTNPDLIRRAPVGENVANPVLYAERLYSKASVRILLSDTAADILNLPTVTATAPVQLDGNWVLTQPNNGTPYGPVDGAHPPIALSPGPQSTVTTGPTNAGDLVINAVVSPYFQPMSGAAALNVGVGGPVSQNGVQCTGRTFNTLIGCTPKTPLTTIAINQPIEWNVNGVVNGANNQKVTSTLTANWLPGSTTITVPNGETGRFAPGTFWMSGTVQGAPVTALVSCAGNTATQLTNCTGVPTTNAGATVTNAVLSSGPLVNVVGLIGGFIKIEQQDANANWTDITMQILNYGIGAPNIDGTICADPTPNAILRIQRLKDNAGGTPTTDGGGCNYGTATSGLKTPQNWWPQVLFDTREGLLRDNVPATITNLALGGVMHYISIDTANLAKWFQGTQAPYVAGTGAAARKDNGGFTVYFSDRRNNRNALNQETSEYGWEDFVNPADANGLPNGLLDPGEDLNANTVLDVYGGLPNYNGVANTVPPGAAAPLSLASSPTTPINRGQAQANRAILFRHALKLINGSNIVGNGITGLTVVTENPVYIQGDWNSTGGNFNGAHAATSVIADAVTLLSNNWTDVVSFTQPYNPNNRPRIDSWYRVAIISGKGAAFVQPNGTATDFGTDGGAHNFLRYLESGATLNYLGSIATFFYNRQAVGTYKCCTTVYGPPTRNYAFDVDFLTPALLPPNTPVFRDMNAVGFSQEVRPGR